MAHKQTEVGKLLALCRDLKGWTLRDLEKECGISNALISQIETGHIKDPGFSTVVRLCRALGLSIERAEKAAWDELTLGVLKGRAAPTKSKALANSKGGAT
jgi:transcriptional regulator with XRE-family HTH domain